MCENSEDSTLFRNVRKQERSLSSSDELDPSESIEERKWEDKQNILKIIAFNEHPGMHTLVLPWLESKPTPHCAFK